LGLREYARHRGCTLRAVQVALQAGRIFYEPDGSIDPVKADQDWAQNTGPKARRAQGHRLRQSPPPRPEPTGSTQLNFAQARAAKEVFEARLRKLELEERQGNLVQRRAVELEAYNRGRVFRDAMLNIPPRVAGLLAAETDAATVHDLLETEIRSVLEQLSAGKLG
jgi:hypothetical protein